MATLIQAVDAFCTWSRPFDAIVTSIAERLGPPTEASAYTCGDSGVPCLTTCEPCQCGCGNCYPNYIGEDIYYSDTYYQCDLGYYNGYVSYYGTCC